MLFVLLGGLAAGADEAPVESWSVVYKYGSRIGYSHSLIYQADNRVVCECTEETTERRMGTPITRRSFTSFWESPQGQPLRFLYRASTGNELEFLEKTGEIDGSVIKVVVNNDGEVTRQEFPFDPTALFPYSASRSLGSIELKPGAVFSYRTLSLGQSLQGQTLRFEVQGRQNVALLDRRADLWRCRVTMDEVPGLEMIQYLTDKLDCWKSEIPNAGITTILGSRQLALAPLDPADTPDAVLSAGVRSNLYILRPRQLTLARYQIGGVPEFPTTYQRMAEGELLVSPPAWPTGAAAGSAEPRYLRPNAWLHTLNPAVQAVVAEVAPAGPDAEAVLALRDWVHREIRRDTLDVGFASDLETLKSRRGDCTEHAVLLASLCRARRIPARIATGLACSGGVFLGHAWTEVKLGEAWIPVDAALSSPAGMSVDATHIKLSDSSLEDPSVPAELGNTVASLGRIRLELVSYVEAGKSHSAEGSGLVEQDGRLSWPQLGLSLTVPPGWTVVSDPTYPYCLALRSGEKVLTFTAQEYAGTEFPTLVDSMGGGLASPRLEKRIDGHPGVLVVGGDSDKRHVKLLVDRGDTYLALQLLDASDRLLGDFMAVVSSLRLSQP